MRDTSGVGSYDEPRWTPLPASFPPSSAEEKEYELQTPQQPSG